MARVGHGLIPDGLESLFDKAIRSGNRYIYVCYRRVLRFFNRARELELLARSYLVDIAALWFGLSEPQRQAWRDVSPFAGGNGWQLFVSDTSERMNLGLPGVATPSQFHQVRVGYLKIEAPATAIEIKQRHPKTYYRKERRAGTQSQYELVRITESFALPLILGINYKANLMSQGAGASALLYARVKSLYQGRDIYTDLTIELDLSTGWKYEEVELTSVLGLPLFYAVSFKLTNVRGDLWFDNPKMYHSGQNWAADPYCDFIDEFFLMPFASALPNWEGINVPTGTSYSSIYVDS